MAFLEDYLQCLQALNPAFLVYHCPLLEMICFPLATTIIKKMVSGCDWRHLEGQSIGLVDVGVFA